MKMILWIITAICRFLCFLFIKFLYAMNWLVVKWGQRFNRTSTATQTSVHTDEEIRQIHQSIDNMEEVFNEIIYCCIQSLKLDMEEVENALHKLRVNNLTHTTAHPSFGTSNVEHQTSTIEATTISSFQASARMFPPVSPDARSSSCLLSTGASKTDLPSHPTPSSAAPIREGSSGTLGSATLPLKGIRAPTKLISTASNTPPTYSSVFTKNADVSQLSNPDFLAAPSGTGAATIPTAPAAARSVYADQTPVAATIKEPTPAEPPSAVTSATQPFQFTVAPAEFISTKVASAKSSAVTPRNQDVRQAFKPCTPAASSHHEKCPTTWKSSGQTDEYAKQTPITGVTTAPTTPAAAFRSAWAYQTLGSVTITEPAAAEPPSATTTATQPIKVITSPAELNFTFDTLAKSSTVTPRNEDVRQAFRPCTPAASSHHGKWPSIWKTSGQTDEYCKQTPITGLTSSPTAPAASRSAWAYQTLGSVMKTEPAAAKPLSATTTATQPIKFITSAAEFSFTLDSVAKSSTVTPRNEDVRQAFRPCTPAASSHQGKWPSIWKTSGQTHEYTKQTLITGLTSSPTARAASRSAWAYQTLGSVTKTEAAPAKPLSATTTATQPTKVITSPAEFSFTLDTFAKSSAVTTRHEDVRQAFKPCTPAASSHHGKYPSNWKIRGQNNEYYRQTPITGVTTAPTAPATSSSAWTDQTPRAVKKKERAPAEPLSTVTSASQPTKVITSPAKFIYTSDASAKTSAVTPRKQDARQAFKPCKAAASSHPEKYPSNWKIRGQNKYCKQAPTTGVTTTPTAPVASRSAWADQAPRATTRKESEPTVPPSVTISATRPIKSITSPAKFRTKEDSDPSESPSESKSSGTNAASSSVTPSLPMYSIYLENKELYEYYSNKKKKRKKIHNAPATPATASN